MGSKIYKFVADFETTTDINDCRVWASCAVEIGTLKTLFLGNNIEDFFGWLKDKNSVCYFHNLKFDGEFIVYYLLTNGYRYSDGGEANTFSSLITDMGLWYSLEVIFEVKNKKKKKVIFYDSLKKLPFKVSTVAKTFELEDSKLSIDYNSYRAPEHVLTEEEKEYIVVDCRIVAAALTKQFTEGLDKMTNASDAMSNFKQILTKSTFERLFPVFPHELDEEIRRAYKGGYVYLNPKYASVRGLQGVTFDVNSLYPYVMYDKLLPYGYPSLFTGEPKKSEVYQLYIVRISCAFDVKPNHLPTIQIKKSRRFVETDYISSSDGDIVDMVLTSVDLELFLDHYDVSSLTYHKGYYFKGVKGLFKDYIDYWGHIKATETGGKRQLAKLMLNSLYGKFATNPKCDVKIPIFFDEIVHFEHKENDLRDPVYTAMGAFITAYARDKTIRSAQLNYDRFIYADTDSLHLVDYDEPTNLEVHKSNLGAWKNEGCFTDSMFIRAKTYMETVDGKNKVTCAGMPDNVKEQVTYDNFKIGSSFTGKLLPKRCPGGVVLVDTMFTIC